MLFRERGLTMEADVVHGQKTGHFLDQRDNRALVRGIAAGRDVLDVFASTGGFALAAAAGGARSVHLVDQSAPAIAAAERNIAHNLRLREVRECAIRTTVGDAFDVLAELGRRAERDADRFDVVVLDPPSFAIEPGATSTGRCAPTPRSPGSGVALLRPGGVLVQASCSSRVTADQFFETVLDAARRRRPAAPRDPPHRPRRRPPDRLPPGRLPEGDSFATALTEPERRHQVSTGVVGVGELFGDEELADQRLVVGERGAGVVGVEGGLVVLGAELLGVARSTASRGSASRALRSAPM